MVVCMSMSLSTSELCADAVCTLVYCVEERNMERNDPAVRPHGLPDHQTRADWSHLQRTPLESPQPLLFFLRHTARS